MTSAPTVQAMLRPDNAKRLGLGETTAVPLTTMRIHTGTGGYIALLSLKRDRVGLRCLDCAACWWG